MRGSAGSVIPDAERSRGDQRKVQDCQEKQDEANHRSFDYGTTGQMRLKNPTHDSQPTADSARVFACRGITRNGLRKRYSIRKCLKERWIGYAMRSEPKRKRTWMLAHFCLFFRGILTKDPIQSELLLENFEANSYGLIPRLSSRCLAANQLLARPCQRQPSPYRSVPATVQAAIIFESPLA